MPDSQLSAEQGTDSAGDRLLARLFDCICGFSAFLLAVDRLDGFVSLFEVLPSVRLLDCASRTELLSER